MHSTQDFPLLTIIAAIVVTLFVVWTLRLLSRQKILSTYLPDNVVTFVTVGVLIYGLCIWVMGPVLVWVSTAHIG
jgi:hypothetical protein